MKKDNNHITPPRLAEKLLVLMLKSDLAEEVLGDLDEKFYSTLARHSVKKARQNYWYQVFNYLRPFALKTTRFKYSNTYTMYKHYLKISIRSLMRSKVFSSIKIGGFAVGIAACILIALFIKHESGYDKHYTEGDRIFRIANDYNDGNDEGRWTNLHGPLKPVLEEHIPDLDKVSRVVLWRWGNVGENHVKPLGSTRNIYDEGFFYADPELLDILEIPMVYGSQQTALTAPNSIVISESRANKYFPGKNPVGEQLVLNDDPNTTFVIGGVMKDFPLTSHLQGHFIMTLAERTWGPGTSDWCCTNYNFYTRLKEGARADIVEEKLVDIRNTYVMPKLIAEGKTDLENQKKYQSFYLQPVSNIYLNREEVGDDLRHGSHDLVWIFGAIAMVILLLACLNFINLSTARSVKRAKEVGMRKVVGSSRSGLIAQHLSESIFFSLLSVAAGALLAYLALPLFNRIASKSLFIPWTELWFIPSLLVAALVIGFISGIYPAFYLSKFKPVEVLKGKAKTSVGTSFLRSGLVVFQFTATVLLIISALVIHGQFDHYMNKSLGYDKEQVINVLGINSLKPDERLVLKEEMLRLSQVQNASLGDYLPVAGSRMTNFNFWIAATRQEDVGFEAARWTVDEDYLPTLGMELVQGRNFTKSTSDSSAIIINERMASAFGLEDPVNTQVIDMFDNKYNIIGVVKDFHFESLTGDIRPLAMVRGGAREVLSLKVSTTDMASTIAAITGVWDSLKPSQPIRYAFMDQRFEQMYEIFLRARTLFLSFSVLSVIVACLGLFALSAYSVEQRNKEISIRKVLGASVNSIFGLLASYFVKLVLLSIVIAIPIGWYLMDAFLADMANRIVLSWPLFALAGVIAMTIAVFTVSFESLKAAFVNPAKTLRSE